MRFPWPVTLGALLLSSAAWNSIAVAGDCGCDTQTPRCNHQASTGACHPVCCVRTPCSHGAGHHRARHWCCAPPPPNGMIVSSVPMMQAAPMAFAAPMSFAAAPVAYAAAPISYVPQVAAAPVFANPLVQSTPIAFPAASLLATPQTLSFPNTSSRMPAALSSITPDELRAVADALQAARAPASPNCSNSNSTGGAGASPLSAPQPPADTSLEDRIKKLEDRMEAMTEFATKAEGILAEHERRISKLEGK